MAKTSRGEDVAFRQWAVEQAAKLHEGNGSKAELMLLDAKKLIDWVLAQENADKSTSADV